MSTAVRSDLTAADFFAWEAEQLDKHEFVHGEVFSMAGGTPEHALIGANVLGSLYGQLAGGPCRVFSSDLAVELEPGGHYAYPDLTIVCGPLERVAHGPAVANPTVVVEVLSRSTASYDRGGKAEAYRRVASLQAVVFVESERRHLEAMVREGDRWLIAEADATGGLALEAIGAVLQTDAVYAGLDLPAGAVGGRSPSA